MKVILPSFFAVLVCIGCTLDSPAARGAIGSAGGCYGSSVIQTALKSRGQRGAEMALQSLSCLDGGALEDVYRSLGAIFVEKPEDVLSALRTTRVPPSNVAPMLVMLPLSFVDDPCAGRQELQRRRQIVLERVSDVAAKSVFLAFLDRAIEKKKKYCLVSSLPDQP